MEWRKSITGHDILTLEGDNYLSFGKDGDIKWVHVSYLDGKGIRRGHTVGVGFTKVPKEAKAVIGEDNLRVLKSVFRGEVVKREKFVEFASTLIK